MICKHKSMVIRCTWHWMSFLRPDVIKQHRSQTQNANCARRKVSYIGNIDFHILLLLIKASNQYSVRAITSLLAISYAQILTKNNHSKSIVRFIYITSRTCSKDQRKATSTPMVFGTGSLELYIKHETSLQSLLQWTFRMQYCDIAHLRQQSILLADRKCHGIN